MNNSRAVIVVENADALRVAASSARISTQQGTALEIFAGSRGDARDRRLIDKVLASGHKSVIEHQTFSIAFNDVSVLVEQFVIECRLASFTVKSRRYVDFSQAGFVVPDGLTDAQREIYDAAMTARFADYQRLLDLGVPKEDARFVLPYCLRSNFFMTVNARELIALICAMLYGRGKGFAEIEALGAQLKEQFDALYPGVVDGEAVRFPRWQAAPLPLRIADAHAEAGDAVLADAPTDAKALLEDAMRFSGRFGAAPALDRDTLRTLLTDARPRELETLGYTFRVKNISLACLTHFTRHRLQSMLIPPVATALAGGAYVLPKSVAASPEAVSVYRGAFEDQARWARKALEQGASGEDIGYFAMSGHQLDILLTMNARQLLHFARLRTCARAQWEIRGVAERMLEALSASCPELFAGYGPSCVYGPCPEGKMTCGKPRQRL